MIEKLSETPPACADTNEAKFHQLLDSTLDYQIEVVEQFLSYYEELNNEPSKRLDVSSLEFSHHWEQTTKMSFTCGTPETLITWKLSLDAVRSKLNLSKTEYEFSKQVVTLTVNTPDVERILKYLNPLIQRTRVGTVKFCLIESAKAETYSALLATCEKSTEPLQKLIDSVIEYQRDETNQLRGDLEELKVNRRKKIVVRVFSFAVESSLKGSKRAHIWASFTDSFVVWNALMKAAFSHMKAPKTSYSINTTTPARKYVSLGMELQNVELFFNYLNPIAPRTKIYSTSIDHVGYMNIHICTKFFENACLRRLRIEPRLNPNFKPILDFVTKVRPEIVEYYRIGHKQEISQFLLPLADKTKVISIMEWPCKRNALAPISLSEIRKIMSRKCSYLKIKGEITTGSIADAEQIVKFFHQLKKKVALKMPTYAEAINTKFGEYYVKINHQTILYEHLEIKGKLEKFLPF